MQLIRATYRDNKGKLHKAFKSHAIKSDGLPLCELCDRQVGRESFRLQKWTTEIGEKPSCTICEKILAKRNEPVAGGAA